MNTTLEKDCSNALARTHAFWNLNASELALVSQIAMEVRMNRGDVLIRAGEPESSLLIITEGTVRVYGHDGSVIAEASEGGVIGEVALFDSQPRSADVVAITEGSLLRFPSLDLWYMLDRHPEIGLKVVNNLGRVMAARLRADERLS